MKRLAQIASLVVVALFLACSNKVSVRETEPIYSPRYAKGFAIERDKESGEVLLCVKNPWQGAKNITYYTPIDSLNPSQRIVAMSSSHAAMLVAVGCADRIVGLSGCRYIYNQELIEAIERGEISEIGVDSNLDFEKLYSLRADRVLLYGVAGAATDITSKLDELQIPYIYIGEYLEDDPLGKAEWIVAIAALCGEVKRGEEIFVDIEKRYIDIKNSVAERDFHPRVMLNLPYRDSWFMPPKGSYMVRLIEDAGGEYVYSKNMSTSSEPISLEEALVYASKADVWINLGQTASVEELRALAPRFTKVAAVEQNRLYNNNKRTNPSRGSDFWESGAVRPDLILADLVKIFHHQATSDSLYYYRRLE